ncbi:MAG: branched-chain amino acid ABC transporter permease [Planctomycetota bacterium]|nr:branched-chain amino acid ABC transporter permease [Planctomycetota bacterium]
MDHQLEPTEESMRLPIPEHGGGKNTAAVTVALVAALLLPTALTFLFGNDYPVFICCFILIYIIAVSGLDIVFGYSGQISLGHAAFYAMGAYGSGLLVNFLDFPAIPAMLAASILASAIGALLAWPASKLVFHFLSLSTIAFGEIVYQIITHSPDKITGDFIGLRSEFVNLFGYLLDRPGKFYYLALALAALFLLAKTHIVDSKVGRAFLAIRENTHAADGMGINVRKYKIVAFTVSAFYTSFAGGMYMHMVGYASPDTALQKQSVLFLTMLLFGGTGTLPGPIFGVVTVMLLVEALRDFQDYQVFIYGILMLIVIVALPGGLYGASKDIYHRLAARPATADGEGGTSDAA